MGGECVRRIFSVLLLVFFFNYTATTEIYTLSLHDALPISGPGGSPAAGWAGSPRRLRTPRRGDPDRKSTRLNSSHRCISYAVFCLKKKKKTNTYKTPHKTKNNNTKTPNH